MKTKCCDICEKQVSAANYARHRRTCKGLVPTPVVHPKIIKLSEKETSSPDFAEELIPENDYSGHYGRSFENNDSLCDYIIAEAKSIIERDLNAFHLMCPIEQWNDVRKWCHEKNVLTSFVCECRLTDSHMKCQRTEDLHEHVHCLLISPLKTLNRALNKYLSDLWKSKTDDGSTRDPRKTVVGTRWNTSPLDDVLQSEEKKNTTSDAVDDLANLHKRTMKNVKGVYHLINTMIYIQCEEATGNRHFHHSHYITPSLKHMKEKFDVKSYIMKHFTLFREDCLAVQLKALNAVDALPEESLYNKRRVNQELRRKYACTTVLNLFNSFGVKCRVIRQWLLHCNTEKIMWWTTAVEDQAIAFAERQKKEDDACIMSMICDIK
jgi:hypothetical protein